MPKRRTQYYDPTLVRDAPEHHEYARAMGSLTCGTWDHQVRPVDERIREFVAVHPPEDPVRFVGSAEMVRSAGGGFAAASKRTRLERFQGAPTQHGSLAELLARYGLALHGGPEAKLFPPTPLDARSAARQRNVRLRVLHGGVDVEAADMDSAKAEYLDRQEKQQAAAQIRAAVKRMRDELGDKDPAEE